MSVEPNPKPIRRNLVPDPAEPSQAAAQLAQVQEQLDSVPSDLAPDCAGLDSNLGQLD